MKREILKTGFAACIAPLFFSLNAQVKNQKKEEIRLKTISTINGVETGIDTTFDSKQNMLKYMKENGIDVPSLPMELNEDVNVDVLNGQDGQKTRVIKKVIKREITVNDSTSDGKKIIELLKDEDLDIRMIEGEEGGVIDINSILESEGLDGKDVKVVIIKRTIEIGDLKEEEKKTANINKEKPLEVEGFDIVPNPGKNEVNLKIQTSKTGKGLVRIMDMTGKILKDYELESLSGTHVIDIKDMSAGTYIIQVAYKGYIKSKKLMIE